MVRHLIANQYNAGSSPVTHSSFRIFRVNAGVMKLVDFRSLEVRVRKSVLVRVQSPAPNKQLTTTAKGCINTKKVDTMKRTDKM